MKLPIRDTIDQNFVRISGQYENMVLQKDKCRECSQFDHYKQVVQAEGNAKDPIAMIIGEAPGADEVEQIRPFIGKAGQRLREELKKHKDTINKKTTLMSNVLSCRPLNNKFPTGQDPKTCCNLWLTSEISITCPQFILLLGNHPLYHIKGCTGITKHRGFWENVDFNGKYIQTLATYHPSYVIRSEKAKKNNVVSDFENDISAFAEAIRKGIHQ